MALQLKTYPAAKNAMRVDIANAYARVAHYDGNKHVVRFKVEVFINAESASLDGQPLGSDECTFDLPQQLDINPVAWAYGQLKQLGDFQDAKDV